jgi:Cu2+-exporting ATPase
VARKLAELGYHAVPYDAGEEASRQQREERFLLRCLAVAGFASANVMLLSISVWAGAGAGEMDAATRVFFGWVSATIALPAVAYAGRPFFRSALEALGARRVNMDVPISLAVLLATGLSLFDVATEKGDTYFEAAVMLLFLLLIGRFLDLRLRGRARGAAQRLASLQVATANRILPSGAVVAVPARDIVPGDRILVGAGDQVPVNGIIEDGRSTLDVSFVTGETTPADIAPGAAVYSGSINRARPLVLRATAARENSLLAEITRLVEAGEQARTRYVRLADKAASLYVPLVHGLALLTFAGWALSGAGAHAALVNAIAVLIITCPCALGLAVPAVQVVATGRLFDRGVLVKSGDTLERLAEADMAVFDKTGTLTLPAPTLVKGEACAEDLALAAQLARASRHPLTRALAASAGAGPVASGVRLGNRHWCGVANAPEAQGPELWLAVEGREPLRFVFADELRPEAAETVAGLRARKLGIALFSGDRNGPVARAAEAAGIGDFTAELSPAGKTAKLRTIAAEGRHVLMVGDGLNDAPALASAHVSISPASAIDASQAAADLVLQGASLAPILEALDVARAARRRAFENLGFAAVYNACAVPLAMAGLVTPLIAAIAMSASSLLVTLNALRLARAQEAR